LQNVVLKYFKYTIMKLTKLSNAKSTLRLITVETKMRVHQNPRFRETHNFASSKNWV